MSINHEKEEALPKWLHKTTKRLQKLKVTLTSELQDLDAQEPHPMSRDEILNIISKSNENIVSVAHLIVRRC